MDEIGRATMLDGNAGVGEPGGIGSAVVAQRVDAGGGDESRRQIGMRWRHE